MEAFKDAIMAHAVYYPVVEILSATAIACVIWFGGNDVIRGATTIGVLAAFIQYAQRFFRPIQDFSEKYNILQSAMAASEHIKLLDTPTEITSPAVTKMPAGPGRIEFDHVWFAYRNTPVEDSGKNAGEGARATQELVPGNGRVGTGLRPVHAESKARQFTPNPPSLTGFSATFPLPSNPAKPSPSSATLVPARPPSSRF